MSDNRAIHSIRVCVRVRPLTQREISSTAPKVVKYLNTRHLTVRKGSAERKYTFDRIFGEHADQIEVYRLTVGRFVNSIPQGFSFTFIVYGQTGTGKSYTLFGEGEQEFINDFKRDKSIGVILRAAHQLFTELDKLDQSRVEYTVRLSFIEINHEQIFDLLDESTPLRIYDDPLDNGSVVVKDVSKVTVFNAQDVNDWINIGRRTLKKSTFYAFLSHLKVTFFVDVKETTLDGVQVLKTGRLNFVELAGGEHASEERTEGSSIRNALDAFEECIKSLGMQQQTIPYRNAKLTRLLQDSLGGTAKACFLTTFSASTRAWTESLSSLQIAVLMKRVANYPRRNIARSLVDATRELDTIIARKETELREIRQWLGSYVSEEDQAGLTDDQVNANTKIVNLLRELLELKQHRASLEAEYNKLDASFIRTKKYLVYAQGQLQAIQEVPEEERRCPVRRLVARNNEIIANANNLLDMCAERVAQAKMPPRQFQNQPEVSHADLAEQVITVTSDALSDVEQATGYYRRQQVARVVNIAQLNNYLRRRFLGDLQQIGDMMRRIKSLQPLDIYDLLNSQARCTADHVAVFINSVYGQISYNMKLPNQPKAEIGKLSDGIVRDTEEIRLTEREIRAELEHHQAERNQHYDLLFRFFDDILKNLDEREARIRIELREGAASLEFMNKELKKAQDSKELLQKEAAFLEKAMQFIRDQLHGQDYSFFEEASQMMSVPGKVAFAFDNLNVDEVCEQFGNAVNDFYTEAAERADTVDDYTDDLMNTFKSIIQTHNNHNARTARQIEIVGKGLKENILEKAHVNTTHIAKIAEGANATSEYYCSKMRNLVDEAKNQLQSIDGKIQLPSGTVEEDVDPENIENITPPDDNLPQGGDDDNEPEK